MDIRDIADFPALRQLAASLWRDGKERGAAILVGAGFSRNAERSGADTPIPPLWTGLRDAMVERLYGGQASSAPSDPLRVAEEFRAYLGRAALTDFLHQHIPDDAWVPGRLHAELMALPWSDVLTVNYDTLLERTPPGFRTVHDATDLARVHRPRVVKLHGSIHGAGKLIITEEDYRTYPEDCAAFVNLARQVFLENELCLIGFSGDDPNFLQWSGWVRDRLGGSARRIYLVGALRLAPAKRRLLESRNISPIDLAGLVEDLPEAEMHSSATDLFLKFLAAAKPPPDGHWEPLGYEAYNFIPTNMEEQRNKLADPVQAAEVVTRVIAIWEQDRRTCPAWLVLPEAKRSRIRYVTVHAWFSLETLDRVEPVLRSKYLQELAWRHSVAFWPLDEKLADRLEGLLLPIISPLLDRAQAATIALCLLRDARLAGNEHRFEKVAEAMSTLVQTGSNSAAELTWQRLLFERDAWNLSALANGIKELIGPDPVWSLRRSSLFAEMGDVTEARRSLAEASADLDVRQTRDPRSLWVLSRRAWTAVQSRALRMSEDYRWYDRQSLPDATTARYDAEEEIDLLRERVERDRKRRSDEPEDQEASFGPGGFQDHTSVVRFSGQSNVNPHDSIRLLADIAGIPLRLPNIDLLASTAAEAADLVFEPTTAWFMSFLYTVDSHDNRMLQRHLSRDALASLPAEIVAPLIDKAREIIQFWEQLTFSPSQEAGRYAEARLQTFIEALSRLIVRAEGSTAREVFDWGLAVGRRLLQTNHRLYEQIDRLLTSCIDTMPEATRKIIPLHCLLFPLPPANFPPVIKWPNPIEKLWLDNITPARDSLDPRWDVRIRELIQNVSLEGTIRAHAVLRLAYLSRCDALTDQEQFEFATAMWARTDKVRRDLPADVNLYPHVIALLPAPVGFDARIKIKQALFDGLPLNAASTEFLRALDAIVVASRGPAGDRLYPSREQAIALLARIRQIFTAAPTRSSAFVAGIQRRAARTAGEALALSILPALNDEDITAEVVRLVLTASDSDFQGAALEGLVRVAQVSPPDLPEVIALLRRSISRGDHWAVLHACRAIAAWKDASLYNRDAPKLPRALISKVLDGVAAERVFGLQPKLWCAGQLLVANVLTPEDIAYLIESLEYLHGDLAYVYPQPGSAGVIGLSMARAECVLLSLALKARGHDDRPIKLWLEAAETDPLPEVRAALVS